MIEKIKAIYKLTRVDVIMDFYPILMFLGFVAARISFDLNVILAMISNLLILVFAFMINDIADADDDAQDPEKVMRNPVSAGVISKALAYGSTFAVAGLAVLFAWPLGTELIGLSVLLLVIGYLYSMKPIRLKARPLIDIISHGFFLAFAQVIFFGLLPGATLDLNTWLVALGALLFSVGGDLYNEVRDWEVDQKAGLNNTANLFGYAFAKRLGYFFWGSGLLLVVVIAFMIGVPVITASLGSF